MKIENALVEEKRVEEMCRHSQLHQRQLSMIANRNVNTVLQVAAENRPYGICKKVLENQSRDSKYYKNSNKPLGNPPTKVDYFRKQRNSSILEFLSKKYHISSCLLGNQRIIEQSEKPEA
jgi:hypothetical protein